MTSRTLIRRSLWFHARAHLGVVLGAAIGSAALIGALIVGDSVKGTLSERAEAKLAGVWYALKTGDRTVRADLQSRSAFLRDSALLLSALGVASKPDGSARVNRVQVLGVNDDWGPKSGWDSLFTDPPSDTDTFSLDPEMLARFEAWLPTWHKGETAVVNETFARQLGLQKGDRFILRLRKPGALALDAALTPRDEDSIALPLRVGAVLQSGRLRADFDLAVNGSTAANVFLPAAALADRMGVSGRANALLFGPEFLPGRRPVGPWVEGSMGWIVRHFDMEEMGERIVHDRRSGAVKLVPRNLKQRVGVLLGKLLMLTAHKPDIASDAAACHTIDEQVRRGWLLDDVEMKVGPIRVPTNAKGDQSATSFVEVSTRRIFLEPAVISAALKPRSLLLTNHQDYSKDTPQDVGRASYVTNGIRVLTYLANLIRAGDRATPYSMVTAAEGPYLHTGALPDGNPDPGSPVLRDDEIMLNQWLADDLKAKPGDTVELSYFVPDSGSRLTERTNQFRVRSIVPLRGLWADRTLMPEFPGVAKAESTRDWDTGFPLTYHIREQDEAYWKTWRGTPKAFITLAAGQKLWANRFGSVTAVRYPVPADSTAAECKDIVQRNLLANLDPVQLGLRAEPVRRQALEAAEQAQDFGQLFLGFSLFLVVAALLLMALLFQFGLDQRTSEVGLLLALGFTPARVRRLFLGEGMILAAIGGVLGALAGVGYARAMLWALATLWRDAVGGAALEFHATGQTLLIGFFASTVVATLTLWLSLRRYARQPAVRLLTGEGPQPRAARRRRWLPASLWVGIGSGAMALGLLGWAFAAGRRGEAENFFSAGSLCLISGLAFCAAWLKRLAGGKSPAVDAGLTLGGLGVRGCARRGGRTLATIALLACGAFLTTSIGVFRLDASKDAADRRSGTGGFALIGQATMPVPHDLNTASGRDALALNAAAFTNTSFVQFRVHEGDEASCLNLNRPQRPRLLGVNPETLAGRFTFNDAAKGLNVRQEWNLLKRAPAPAGAEAPIPAIGDANAIEWGLGKALGDTLDYTDESGRAFKIKLVGAVENSILQGGLIIDEEEFVKRFPGEGGYKMFLIDAPAQSAGEVSATLSRALQDSGLEVTSAVARLNAFNAVQNTYLDTFEILGGLGLLLGSAGLGVVVLRNVLERRGELALLSAVGFRPVLLRRMVLCEHAALLGLGLGVGVLAAAVAVLPSLLASGVQTPWRSLTPMLAAVLVNGLVWTWVATRVALRGNLLAALRNE